MPLPPVDYQVQPYPAQAPAILDGTPQTAASVNSKLSVLAQRDDSIKEQLDWQRRMSSVVHAAAPMQGANIIPGTPVYMDPNGIYRPTTGALIASGNTLQLPQTAMPFGLCMSKTTNTLGDVVFSGLFTLSAAELQAVLATGQTPRVGALYLSPNISDVGRLTFTPVPDSTIVGACTGPTVIDGAGNQAYTLFVCPQWRTSLDVYSPQRYVINGANFRTATAADRLVVPGCAYAYNLSSDSVLSAVWATSNVQNCTYMLEGQEADTSSASPQIVVNSTGIYWMDPDGSNGHALDIPANHPRHELWIGRPRTGNTAPCVTSLTSDGTVKLTDPNGNPTTAGAMRVGVSLASSATRSVQAGSAFKQMSGPGGVQLMYGDVVDSLWTGTPDTVSITGTAATDPANGTRGIARIDVVIPSTQIEQSVDYVRLNQTDPRVYNNVMDYMAVQAGGSVVGRFRIPDTQGSANYSVVLRTEVLCRVQHVPPTNMTIQAFVVPPAAAINSQPNNRPMPSALSTAWGAPVTIGWLPQSAPASSFYAFEVDFSGSANGLGLGNLPAGSVVYFMLSRSAAVDSLLTQTFDILTQWFRQTRV